ncbi:LysE family translocator [Lentibacillus sp. Marseille-P4043]|uniref:LysE family translocator n=1 Tax=Lentibacillus sp. Marseille-P4043 TaxID=2040293 RepID=UPI0018F89032|nr:LysE family translocator [Lentibacillus sp. Marseille-P4043]
MLDTQTFGMFIIAALVLLVIPGPSVLYIIARSLDQGRLAGLVSVLGNALGSVILSVAAAAGLSAILASSGVVFNVVKYLGAAYLIYLGINRLFSNDSHDPIVPQRKRLLHIFNQGIIVAVLNPKTVLFFVAFVPQFVDASQGGIWEQTLFFGLMLVILGVCTDSIYALLAGTAGNWLNRRGILGGKLRYVSSGIYMVLGVVFAFSGSGKR